MSHENASVTSSVIDLAGAGAAVRWGRASHRDTHGDFARRAARPFAGEGRGSSARSAPRADDALPTNDFLEHLYREKRRSERSNTPLSVVLYAIDVADGFASRHVDSLLEVLHGAKRETDILGLVGDDRIAVLCPDTDRDGTGGFMRKIDDLAGELPFSAMAATYPDQLFDNLASTSHERPAFQPFLGPDRAGNVRHGYPLKRAIDIVGALVAIVAFGPLMLLTALAVKLTSHGPVVFRQTRLGKDGVPFSFFKFRSMAMGSDESIHRRYVASLIQGETAAPAGDTGAAQAPNYKLKADPRITRVGRIIRKTSIDELPQFYNVLRGDMSLVGPRPPIPYETENYQSWHLRRLLTLKPGITGLWQVTGRSTVTFNEMVRMDLRYIRDCSLALDLAILLRTVMVVIRCKGAA